LLPQPSLCSWGLAHRALDLPVLRDRWVPKGRKVRLDPLARRGLSVPKGPREIPVPLVLRASPVRWARPVRLVPPAPKARRVSKDHRERRVLSARPDLREPKDHKGLGDHRGLVSTRPLLPATRARR
jgi:hypothetical protein